MRKNKIAAGIIGAALCAMITMPAFAQTDNTIVPSPASAGPTTTMYGVISGINWNLCSNNRSDCVTVMDVTAAPAPVLMTGEHGTAVAANDPIRIIIPAGSSIAVVRSGNTLSPTALRKGDEISVDYQAFDYGNVATNVQLRGHDGIGQAY